MRTIQKCLFGNIIGAGVCAAALALCVPCFGESSKPRVKTAYAKNDEQPDESSENESKPMTAVSKETLTMLNEKWDNQKPSAYSYTLTIIGFTPSRGTYRVTFTDKEYTVRNEAGETIDSQTIPSIHNLFEILKKIIQKNNATYTVTFDETYGFPSSICIQWGESQTYIISDFQPLDK